MDNIDNTELEEQFDMFHCNNSPRDGQKHTDTNLGKHLIIDKTLADFCDVIGINPEECINDFLTKVDEEQREPSEAAVNTQRQPAQDPPKITRTVDPEG